eukprot:30738-Pelagococcus_subviridis.AAC.8
MMSGWNSKASEAELKGVEGGQSAFTTPTRSYGDQCEIERAALRGGRRRRRPRVHLLREARDGGVERLRDRGLVLRPLLPRVVASALKLAARGGGHLVADRLRGGLSVFFCRVVRRRRRRRKRRRRRLCSLDARAQRDDRLPRARPFVFHRVRDGRYPRRDARVERFDRRRDASRRVAGFRRGAVFQSRRRRRRRMCRLRRVVHARVQPPRQRLHGVLEQHRARGGDRRGVRPPGRAAFRVLVRSFQRGNALGERSDVRVDVARAVVVATVDIHRRRRRGAVRGGAAFGRRTVAVAVGAGAGAVSPASAAAAAAAARCAMRAHRRALRRRRRYDVALFLYRAL